MVQQRMGNASAGPCIHLPCDRIRQSTTFARRHRSEYGATFETRNQKVLVQPLSTLSRRIRFEAATGSASISTRNPANWSS